MAPGAFETVTSYLSWDHERLDALRRAVAGLTDEGRVDEARAAFAAFEARLLRHIRIEEEILFPVFEARSGFLGGPTTALRRDHDDIARTARRMGAALQASDREAFREAHAFLREILGPHVSREEHILYPTTDQLLSPRERALLARRLQEE
ncbi:MAG TPA: hemerythrin domain-containing protein [Vicinamibacteria bacterium]|nr:hemerythrin domain-containing protein [Vicinamibacteria bacterium]